MKIIITTLTIVAVLAALCWLLFDAYMGNLNWLIPVSDDPIPPENVVVMMPGMAITAETPAGTIRIDAGNGLKRSYTWDGECRSVTMRPRRKVEARGMGIGFPGAGQHWWPNHGVTRGVLQEGVLNFETQQEAIHWLALTPASVKRLFTHDGLTILFGRSPGRNQINVDVFQVLVNGVKPQALPGATDDKIRVTRNAP